MTCGCGRPAGISGRCSVCKARRGRPERQPASDPNVLRRRRYHVRVADGCCVRCGDPLPVTERHYSCAACREARARWRAMRAAASTIRHRVARRPVAPALVGDDVDAWDDDYGDDSTLVGSLLEMEPAW